jgi:hypothetical protein
MVFDCVYGRREAVATSGNDLSPQGDSKKLYHTRCRGGIVWFEVWLSRV